MTVAEYFRDEEGQDGKSAFLGLCSVLFFADDVSAPLH